MQQVTHRYGGIQLITSQLSGDSSSGEHITQKENYLARCPPGLLDLDEAEINFLSQLRFN